MGANSTYTITIEDGEVEDFDYLMYRLRKAYPEASHYVTEQGRSTGNEGEWGDLDMEMREFSASHPHLLFRVDETIEYEDTTYARHWFKGGKSLTLQPELVWPDFDESKLA